MSLLEKIGLPKGRTGQFIIDGVADGFEAFALASAAAEAAPDGSARRWSATHPRSGKIATA